MKLNELTIQEAHEKLLKKEISSLELTEAVLDEIEKRDGELHVFLTKTPELAREAAKAADEKLADGDAIDVLAGIPAAIKDNILVEGVRATAASKILEPYIAAYDATVIEELKRRGAVIVGKTNLDEFAMGSSTENSAFGPTKNPVDIGRVPGGSSGGSAAAVRAHLAIYALGSDTGGSIRQPAAFCGVVGLKPTYGTVSRYGLIAMASSLDQIGPFTKTVEDSAIVFAAIAGKDPLDSTSVEYQFKYNIPNPKPHNLKPIRIGVPKEYFVEGLDPGVEKAVRAAIKKLEELGAKIEEVSLPHTQYALACYYLIMPSEVSANLARFDGIRYGESRVRNPRTRAPKENEFPTGQASSVRGRQESRDINLMDVYLKTRQEGFGDEVRRRVMLGTYALSAGYYDAYYLKAQKVRTLIKQDFEKAFEKVDALVTPTTPTPAFKFGEKTDDPISMYLSDIYTVSINLAGVPAISIPCGTADSLPVGLQIIGKHFDEKTIFQVAGAYEQAIEGR